MLATVQQAVMDYHLASPVQLLGMQVAAQLEQVTIEPKAA
jgi:hypothetical protein